MHSPQMYKGQEQNMRSSIDGELAKSRSYRMNTNREAPPGKFCASKDSRILAGRRSIESFVESMLERPWFYLGAELLYQFFSFTFWATVRVALRRALDSFNTSNDTSYQINSQWRAIFQGISRNLWLSDAGLMLCQRQNLLVSWLSLCITCVVYDFVFRNGTMLCVLYFVS